MNNIFNIATVSGRTEIRRYSNFQSGVWYIGSLTLTAEEYTRPIQSVVRTPHDTLNLLYE